MLTYDQQYLVTLFSSYPNSKIEILKFIEEKRDSDFVFLNQGYYFTPATFALAVQDFQLCRLFVENGTSLKQGNPLLELTAWESYSLEHVMYLVDNGADVDIQGDSTPFFNVCWDNNIFITSYLVSKGANINYRNRSGLNGIHNALSSPHFKPSFLAYLVRIGVNIEVIDRDGWDVVYVAKRNGVPNRIVEMLSSTLSRKTSTIDLITFLEAYPDMRRTQKEKIKISFEVFNDSMKKTIMSKEYKVFQNVIPKQDQAIYKKVLSLIEDNSLDIAMDLLKNISFNPLAYERFDLMAQVLIKSELFLEVKELINYLEILNENSGNPRTYEINLLRKIA